MSEKASEEQRGNRGGGDGAREGLGEEAEDQSSSSNLSERQLPCGTLHPKVKVRPWAACSTVH